MPPKKQQGGGKKGKENLEDLKQELDIDYHKITPEELYQRFQTHPENVSMILDLFNQFDKADSSSVRNLRSNISQA